MRNVVVVAVIFALMGICSLHADGYQIAVPETELISIKKNDAPSTLLREKRQMETFDDEDLGAQQQEPEEPGFWDRVVKVAVKLFARFVEWLNS